MHRGYGHLKFNSSTQKVVITFDSDDPNRVYWGDYVKEAGLRIQDFDTENSDYPDELIDHKTEVQQQTDDCIEQWRYGGCLNLIKLITPFLE